MSPSYWRYVRTEKLSRNRTIPYGLSQLGVGGCEFDLLQSAAGVRSCAEQAVVLRFSPDNQFLYHAYRTKSLKYGVSYDCLITVDLWCTTRLSRLYSVAVEKQVSPYIPTSSLSGDHLLTFSQLARWENRFSYWLSVVQQTPRISGYYMLRPTHPLYLWSGWGKISSTYHRYSR
jgi:hypothetical protein